MTDKSGSRIVSTSLSFTVFTNSVWKSQESATSTYNFFFVIKWSVKFDHSLECTMYMYILSLKSVVLQDNRKCNDD